MRASLAGPGRALAAVVAGFAVLLALVLAIGLVGWNQLRATTDIYEERVEQRARLTKDGLEMKVAVGDQSAAVRGYIITAGGDFLVTLTDGRRRFEGELTSFASRVETGEGRVLLDEVRRRYAALQTLYRRVEGLVGQGRMAGARALFEARIAPARASVDEALNLLVGRQEERLNEGVRVARERAARAEGALLGLSIAALVFGGMVAVLVVGALRAARRRADAAVFEALRIADEQSHIAHVLQQSLLPEIPDLPGLEVASRYLAAGAANEVGGDLYDLFTLDASEAGCSVALVADVCGKGPEAAALTALLRYTARVVAESDDSPAAVLARLNAEMIRHSPDSTRFATAVCVRIGPIERGFALTLASGGHPLPYVLRQDGRVEQIGRTGSLLGVFSDRTFAEVEATLAPGDALVLYTDGVTEARRRGAILGEDAVREVLAACVGMDAEAVAERITTTVSRFQDGLLADDVALLVVRAPVRPSDARPTVSRAPTAVRA